MKKIFTLLSLVFISTLTFAAVNIFNQGISINNTPYTTNTNIGSFAPNKVSITAGAAASWQNSGDDVCSVVIDYSIAGGTSGALSLNYAGNGPSPGDKLWVNTANTNISNLPNGTYTLVCNYKIIGKFGGTPCVGGVGNDFTTGTLQTLSITFTIDSALPIALSLFNVEKNNLSNKLTWTTETETNGSHFDVEKSTDNKTWKSIGQVTAKGNSLRRENYAFDDASPNAINYYRLKMIDRDGSFLYSKIITVRMTSKGEVSISPNPVQSNLFVNVIDAENENLKVSVSNYAGQIVLEKNITIYGNGNLTLSMEDFQSGIYIISVTDENKNVIATKRIVKQ
jgi:Secretion system C-terminal sorting domain